MEPAATVPFISTDMPRNLPEAATMMPRIAGYEIMHVLGHGGTSTVYLASQTALKRRVAIKMIRRGEWNDSEQRARFRREAESIATLQHPNVVQIFEVGEADGVPFLVLEYVSGGTLHRLVNGRPLPVEQAASIVQQLASAIQTAHDRDIIHRDLKPANILLTGGSKRNATAEAADLNAERENASDAAIVPRRAMLDGRLPKITDFGLALHLREEIRQTRSGLALGTPNYMSPEQAVGNSSEIGKPADIYGLGTILYETLTGRPPFDGDSQLEIMLMVRHDEPVPPSRLNRKVPRDIETICMKCLEKDPARRYASALDLELDLERFLNGQPVHARPIGFLGRTAKWAKRRPSSALAALAGILLFLGLVAYLITVQSLYSRLKATNQELEKKTRELEQLNLRDRNRNRDLRDLLNGVDIDPAEWVKLARNHPSDIWAQLRAFDALLARKKLEDARPFLEHAREEAGQSVSESPSSFEAWGNLASVHDRASEWCKTQDDWQGSWNEEREAVRLRRWLCDNDPDTLHWRLDLSFSLVKLARLHLQRHLPADDQQASLLLHERLKLLFELPDSAEILDARIATHEMLAQHFRNAGEIDKANEHGEHADRLRVKRYSEKPNPTSPEPAAPK